MIFIIMVKLKVLTLMTQLLVHKLQDQLVFQIIVNQLQVLRSVQSQVTHEFDIKQYLDNGENKTSTLYQHRSRYICYNSSDITSATYSNQSKLSVQIHGTQHILNTNNCVPSAASSRNKQTSIEMTNSKHGTAIHSITGCNISTSTRDTSPKRNNFENDSEINGKKNDSKKIKSGNESSYFDAIVNVL